MFTGIIETTAKVISRSDTGLEVQRPDMFDGLKIGQSIAVNGACLTLTEFDDERMEFDVVPETFARTNLDCAEIVNLERALKADGRFEGHVVQGHVDGTLKLLERKKEGAGERLIFRKDEGREGGIEVDKYIVHKGSICLNGVSLTVAKDNPETFEVAIIPHTLENTNFSDLQPGDEVNFECDVFLKWMEKRKRTQ